MNKASKQMQNDDMVFAPMILVMGIVFKSWFLELFGALWIGLRIWFYFLDKKENQDESI